MKIGDKVYLKDPFWNKNENLGGRCGVIVSTRSYILVQIQNYDSNPVKCFRNEISLRPMTFYKKKR